MIKDIVEFAVSAWANLIFKCSVLQSDGKLQCHQIKSLKHKKFWKHVWLPLAEYFISISKFSIFFNKQIENV